MNHTFYTKHAIRFRRLRAALFALASIIAATATCDKGYAQTVLGNDRGRLLELLSQIPRGNLQGLRVGPTGPPWPTSTEGGPGRGVTRPPEAFPESWQADRTQDREPPARVRRPSFLESDYQARLGQPIGQFGYDFAGTRTLDRFSLPVGTLDDNYELGVGDQLDVTFRGQETGTYTVPVNLDGRVVLPNLPPISAAGRTFDAFRRDLQQKTQEVLVGSSVYASVSAIRSISLMVIGEVEQPGIQNLNSFSSVVDALVAAGGIKKTGSLRRISVNRGRQVFRIDLYDLLFRGTLDRNLKVRAGDQIVVPTIGATVAIGGSVKRPAIYELPSGQTSLPLATALGFAGGPLRPRGNRLVRISINADGREQVGDIKDRSREILTDGDIVVVRPGGNIQLGEVRLAGRVRVPGLRSLRTAPTLSALLPDRDSLGRDAYLPFAVIERTDQRTHTRRLLAVNLLTVLNEGRTNPSMDVALQSADVVIVLGSQDIEYLASSDVQAVLSRNLSPSLELALMGPGSVAASAGPRGPGGNEQVPSGGTPDAETGPTAAEAAASPGGTGTASQVQERRGASAQPGGLYGFDEAGRIVPSPLRCEGLRMLFELVSAMADRPTGTAQRLAPRDADRGVSVVPCPSIYDQYPRVLPFALEYAGLVTGEVRAPGVYPIATQAYVSDMIRVAGGPTRKADFSNVELFSAKSTTLLNRTQLASARLEPGSVLRVSSQPVDRAPATVVLRGEVRQPGTYSVRNDETLFQVLQRAGGLTPVAYPLGAFFTRASARKEQQAALEQVARQLSISLATQLPAAAAASDTSGNAGTLVNASQTLIANLRSTKATGRIVVEGDPTVLEVRPELDILLESGDEIEIPKRPSTVTVTGAVLNPSTVQFRTGANVDQYISLAGGLDRGADAGLVFVVLPNGEAKPASISYWNSMAIQVPPGSTIVVPRDLTPFSLPLFIREATDILSKVALTAASFAVIFRN